MCSSDLAFERICIESDMHLAEVAACHHILATMAADPQAHMPLDAAARARLLAAMKQRSTEFFAESERQEKFANSRMVRGALRSWTKSSDGEPADEDAVMFDAGRHTLPASPTREPVTRRSSRGAWAAAIAAVAVLALLGVLLVQSIVGGRQRREGVKRDAVAVAPAAGDAEESPPQTADARPVPEDAEEPPETVATAAALPPEPAAEQPVKEPVKEPVEAVAAAEPRPPAPPIAASEQPRVPLGDALAIAAPVDVVPARPAEPRPAAADGPAAETTEESLVAAVLPAVGFVGSRGLLLHKSAVEGEPQPSWVAFPSGAALGDREDLLVPAGFHPDVNVRGVTLRLLPGTRATLSLDADGTPRIELVFGRAVARASRADARLGVTAGGLVGTITAGLVDPVAIEVELQRPAGVDPEERPARVRAGIMAAAGGLGWRQAESAGAPGGGILAGIAREGMLEARAALRWDSLDPGVATLDRRQAMPSWIESAPHLDKLERGACEALEAKVAATEPLTTALRELAADKRAENRMIAVETLALLGEYDELVELLSADGPGRKLEGRQWLSVEAATVPLALARGTTATGRLQKAFADRGPHGKAESLYAMARGFTDADLANGADAALVEALADADLVVRRYAIKCLCDIVQPSAADRLRYRPDGLPDLRRDGVNWWRGQLEKGLIRRAASRE